MIQRTRYLSRIEPLVGKDVIKVLVGMRRCGKSTLLQQVADGLGQQGVPEQNIVRMNFESLRWAQEAASPEQFYRTVSEMLGATQGKTYLFFDEIQIASQWERVVNSLRADFDCDIYVTGSNSKLLSGELATLLAGRYVTVEVQPFSLAELMEALPNASSQEVFALYSIMGSLPFLSHIGYEEHSSLAYLRDVFNSVVLKDIVQRCGFRKSEQLEKVLSFFISEIGTTISVENITNVLKSEGREASADSIYNYLQAAEDAMLLSRVQRFDVKGKGLLRGGEKVYVADVGLREGLLGSNERRPDLVYENLVFNELVRRGFQVSVGKNGLKEIDFVAQREDLRLYIQVAYRMELESTREREYGAFAGIDDNYPKFVVCGDEVDWSRNGYGCWNIVDFLLSEEWEKA